ncbi:MAG: RNA polymerase sigma factor [Flavobacteriales bacterium]
MIQLQIDQETIEGCRKKQPQAQENLYRICYPVFMRICLRYTRSYDDAANMLQEGFIKILMRIDGYKGAGDFIGWMRRIIINTALDQVRKEKIVGHVVMAEVPDMEDKESEEESKFIIDEKQMLVLIRELPRTQSVVFNLFVMENYSHQEIADELLITVSSSKWYLFDARKILQKKLAHYVNV